MGERHLYAGEKQENFTVVYENILWVDGGYAKNGLIYGSLIIRDGGMAESCKVSGQYVPSLGFSVGGHMEIREGGEVVGTIVQGKVDSEFYSLQTSIFDGSLTISGGIARNTLVESFAFMTINGGIADGVTLQNKAVLTINDGAMLTGTLSFETGSAVSFAQGGILNFDVSRQTIAETPLLSNFSQVQNISQAIITITVNPNQEAGNYCLSSNVKEFPQNVTIQTQDSVLGILNLNESLDIPEKNTRYTINLTDKSLWLKISDIFPNYSLVALPEEGSYQLRIFEEQDKHNLALKNTYYSLDLTVDTLETRLRNLPKGTYILELDGESLPEQLTSQNTETHLVKSSESSGTDFFFSTVSGIWNEDYLAHHLGIYLSSWTGTHEMASMAGKNKICDVFQGGIAPTILFLTNDVQGDALFLDDIYSEFPDELAEQQARIAQINHIYAGNGDDLIDLTSQRFAYTGQGITMHGGQGNDVIWANQGENYLFGDSGNDRLVGGPGNDVIVGGIGNDSMHGGGGNDVFCFCNNWGQDTVEQLADGKVTLWFVDGNESNWDKQELTYRDGQNSVKVTGVTSENISVLFGKAKNPQYDSLLATGAFDAYSQERIFNNSSYF